MRSDFDMRRPWPRHPPWPQVAGTVVSGTVCGIWFSGSQWRSPALAVLLAAGVSLGLHLGVSLALRFLANHRPANVPGKQPDPADPPPDRSTHC